MTPKQKQIVAILAIANLVVILALVTLATHSPGIHTSPLPRPTVRVGTSVLDPQAEDVAEPGQTAPVEGSATLSQTSTVAETFRLEACQWQGAQLLAQAGLGGTVVIFPGGLLRFEIVHSLSPDETTDEVAQLVWTVFDVALVLQGQADECSALTRIEVTITAIRSDAHQAQSSSADTQISASVSAADLAAFGAGELSEDEFIARVTYATSQLP